jgi:hypothetical protein
VPIARATASRVLGRTAASSRLRSKVKLPAWLGDVLAAAHLHRGPKGKARGRWTEERPFLDLSTDFLGVDLGLTLSETERVMGGGSFEFVHVTDGRSHNLETVLVKRPIGFGQLVELQGPALNTTGVVPSGVRFGGIGLTSDFYEPRRQRALSYTLEAKLTQRALFYWAPFYGAKLGRLAERAIGVGTNSGITDAIATAVPFISAGLALQSCWKAFRIFRDGRSSTGTKLLAAGHAAADVTRVFFPLAGTLANAALIAVSGIITYQNVRGERVRAQPQGP